VLHCLTSPQAEQVADGTTSSSKATQANDDTIGVEATASDNKSTTTAAATTKPSCSNGSIHVVDVPETDTHSNVSSSSDKNTCNSSSSSDKSIATNDTAITAAHVDTNATIKATSCISSAINSAVVTPPATTTTPTTTAAAPKARGSTASGLLSNDNSSSSSTVLPRARPVVDTRKQAVTSNTNTVKVSLLR
jgi:hypothetical protein